MKFQDKNWGTRGIPVEVVLLGNKDWGGGDGITTGGSWDGCVKTWIRD